MPLTGSIRKKTTSTGKIHVSFAWLRELVKDISDAKEFLEAVKGEVVPETVYVFTPKGDIKELPVGSTPVDFAYSIHTQVGHKCVGAKANGRIVPLRYKLSSGDVVEIITSPAHGPSKDWLKFVITQRAKARVKQWVKVEERKKSIELGTKLLEEEIKRHGLPFSVLKSEKMGEIIKSFNLVSIEDLYVSVGYGKVSAHQVVNRFMPEKAEGEIIQKVAPKPHKESRSIITITGIDNVMYHLGKCCFPVPGDEIEGFITKGKGVTIHRRDCRNLERLAVDSERLIEVEWSQNGDATSTVKLYIEGMDKPGILANVTALISGAEVNISHLQAASTHDKRALIEFTLEVKNRNQLVSLVNKISQLDGVLSVRR